MTRDKLGLTKFYTENERLSNSNPTANGDELTISQLNIIYLLRIFIQHVCCMTQLYPDLSESVS